MTLVATTIVHPNPGVAWGDVQKQLKRACELARKHGAENVTVLVNMVGGEGDQRHRLSDDRPGLGHERPDPAEPQYRPGLPGLLLDAGQIATWENYVSKTIPDM
jgi:hypothetical protein